MTNDRLEEFLKRNYDTPLKTLQESSEKRVEPWDPECTFVPMIEDQSRELSTTSASVTSLYNEHFAKEKRLKSIRKAVEKERGE
jgi:hypothetical protein